MRILSFLPAQSASDGLKQPVTCAPGWWVIVLFLATVCTGCNGQDAECLSRIGRKIAAHTKSSAGDVGSKLDFGWSGTKKELTLQEKVQDRLRWEKSLTNSR